MYIFKLVGLYVNKVIWIQIFQRSRDSQETLKKKSAWTMTARQVLINNLLAGKAMKEGNKRDVRG